MVSVTNSSIVEGMVQGLTTTFTGDSFFLVVIFILLMVLLFMKFRLPGVLILFAVTPLIVTYYDLFNVGTGIVTFVVSLFLLVFAYLFLKLVLTVIR